MGGMVSKAASSLPSGGKSSPAPQNAYGASYQAPAANVYQPSYGGGGGSAAPSSGGGKSSGLGQGGYGSAPAFGVLQPTAQTQPSFEQSPFPPTPLNSSVNTTTTADMMGGNRNGGQGFGQTLQSLGMLGGGKSSGAGQGGYGAVPSFGSQQPTAQTQPSFGQSPFPPTPLNMMGDDFGRGNRDSMPMQGGKSLGGVGPYGGAPGFGGQQPPQQGGFGQFNVMNDMLRGQQIGDFGGQPANNFGQFGDPRSGFDSRNSFYPSGAPVRQVSQERQPLTGGPGAPPPQQPQGGFGQFNDLRYMLPDQPLTGGPGAPPPQQVQQRMATPEELEQQRLNPAPQLSFADQQRMDAQRNNLMNQVRNSPVTQRMFGGMNQMGGMGGGFQQQQFNPFQQQQTPESLYAANMGMPPPPPQRGISGLQGLYGNMMNQQQQMQQQSMQRMPRMPRFQSQALQYRPDMTQAQAALSRVKPSVQKEAQDAQAARIAELEAQLAGYQTPSGE